MLDIFAKLIDIIQLIISDQSVPKINLIDLELFKIDKKFNLIRFIKSNAQFLNDSILDKMIDDVIILKLKSNLEFNLCVFFNGL